MAKPNRLKKLLLFGLGGLALLLMAAVLLVPVLVDVDSYRPRIEALAQEKLGREVELGGLGLRVLPSIAVTVDGLAVADDGAGRLVEAKSVQLGAELGPLLGGRLAIGRVTVEEPKVTVRRLADGRFELMDLLGGGGPAAGESRVSIQELRVQGGSVVFEDASLGSGAPVRHTLSELDLELGGLDRTDRPHDVELSAKVPSISPETRVAWSGRVSRDLSLEGKLELAAFELAALAGHASALGARDFSKLAGRVDAELELERDAEGGLAAKGSSKAAGLVLPREGEKPLRLPDFELDLDLDAPAKGRVSLDRFDLRSGTTQLSATGSLESEGDERRLALELPRTELRLDDLRELARRSGADLPLDGLQGKAVSVAGKLRAIADISEGFELKSVDLDGVRVEGLTLAVVRGRDGRFDFQGDGQAKAAGKKSGSELRVAARDVRVSKVAVRFEDRAIGDTPVVTEIEDIEIAIDKWLPGKSTPLRVSGRLAGGSASLDGDVGPLGGDAIPVNLQAKLAKIDVAAVSPYLSHYAGLNADRGRLELDSRLKGSTADSLAMKGKLRLDDARVQLPDREPLGLDLTIDHDFALEKGGDRVRLRELTLGLPGGPVGFDGLIDMPNGGTPSFDVGTRGRQRLTTDDLRYLIGLFGAQTGVTLDAGEPLILDARLKKRGSEFTVQGSAELRKLLVRHALLGDQALRVARADVALRGDEVALEQVLLQLGESDLSGSLSLKGFDRHRVGFDLRSEQADLDELFAFAGRTGEGGEAKAADGTDALGRTRATGRLRVKRATLKELEFSDFDARIELAERELRLKPAAVQLYGGRADMTLSADLGAQPLSYQANGELAALQVRDLLLAGLGYGDLSGTGGGRLQLSGTAGSPKAAVAAATGSGNLALTDGTLGGLNMLEILKDAEVFGERSLAELGARLSQDGTSFERLDADYSLAGGVLELERLLTETPEARITASGPVNLVSQQLGLDAVVLFNKQLSAKLKEEGSRAAKYFWNDRAQAVRIPMRIVGGFAKPKADIDWEEAIAQYAEGEIGRQLGQVLGGGSKEEPEGEERRGGGLGDLLGGVLGGGRSEPEPEPEPATKEPAPSSGSSSDSDSSSGGASGAAPSVELRRVRTGGNFLVPDVKVEAVLSGTDLKGALIVVKDGGGKVVHRDENAFESQVNSHYASGGDRKSSASIEVSWKLDGEEVAGMRGLTVSVTPLGRSGAKGSTVTQPVKSKKLF